MFVSWDPGYRSQPGAPTAPSHEAVPRQTQPAGLFVANNWFSFFPSVPEWSTVRFWLLEICVCEMTMTVLCKWVSCSGLPISDWGKLFLIICYFSWMTGLANHRALSLIPDWIAPKCTWSIQCSVHTCCPHKPSWKHISHALLLVLCSRRCLFIAGKEQECCPTRRAARCLSSTRCEYFPAASPWWQTRTCRRGKVGPALAWCLVSDVAQALVGSRRCPWSCWQQWYGHAKWGSAYAQEAISFHCVVYVCLQQRVVQGKAASFVTVVALNRKWLIFHDYFSVRHDSVENASVWLAVENDPALLSFLNVVRRCMLIYLY